MVSEKDRVRAFLLERPFTSEELCAHLPVKQVWYQLGLWLGVNESKLQVKHDSPLIVTVLEASESSLLKSMSKLLEQLYPSKSVNSQRSPNATNELEDEPENERCLLLDSTERGYTAFMLEEDAKISQINHSRRELVRMYYHNIKLRREEEIITVLHWLELGSKRRQKK